MVSVAGCFVLAGLVLFGLGVLSMLCCHAMELGGDVDGSGGLRGLLWSVVLMFSGLSCVVVPVVLRGAGLV